MRILIRNGAVLTVNGDSDVFESGFIAIHGKTIEAVGPMGCEPTGPYDRTIDGNGMVVLPGLINLHQHLWMNLFKGLADGMRLEPWAFTFSTRARQAMSLEDVRLSARLSAVEMLRSGTTCVLNHQPNFDFGPSERVVAEALGEIGIRHVLAAPFQCRTPRLPDYPLSPEEAHAALGELITELHDTRDGLLRLALVIECNAHHTELGKSSDELVRAGYALAKERDLPIAAHMSGGSLSMQIGFTKYRRQTGRSDVEYLEGLGVLDHRWILKHGIHFSDSDIKAVAQRKAHVVYTPTSESIRGGGLGPWIGMRRAGVNCALGTDGPAVDYSTDMVEQIKACIYLQSLRYRTAEAISPQHALALATINGARAIGLDQEIGSLEVGKRADIAIFAMSRPVQRMNPDPLSALVYGTRGSDARTVVVNGLILIEDGKLTSQLDVAGLVAKADERGRAMARESGLAARGAPQWQQAS